MLFLLQGLIFVAALCAVLAATLGAFWFAGQAMNRGRAPALRAKAAGLAALCALAIPASAGAGFWGAGALLYFASR